MENKYQTIKIWKGTLSKLRLLAALREQPIVNVLDELIEIALTVEKNKPGRDCTSRPGSNHKL